MDMYNGLMIIEIIKHYYIFDQSLHCRKHYFGSIFLQIKSSQKYFHDISVKRIVLGKLMDCA